MGHYQASAVHAATAPLPAVLTSQGEVATSENPSFPSVAVGRAVAVIAHYRPCPACQYGHCTALGKLTESFAVGSPETVVAAVSDGGAQRETENASTE